VPNRDVESSLIKTGLWFSDPDPKLDSTPFSKKLHMSKNIFSPLSHVEDQTPFRIQSNHFLNNFSNMKFSSFQFFQNLSKKKFRFFFHIENKEKINKIFWLIRVGKKTQAKKWKENDSGNWERSYDFHSYSVDRNLSRMTFYFQISKIWQLFWFLDNFHSNFEKLDLK